MFITTRTGYVKVINQTGKDILAVCVAHKYSNVFAEKPYIWGPLPNGKETVAEERMKVQYNTGLASGADWWHVIYCDAQNNIYHSDPTNLRGLVDFLDILAAEMSLVEIEMGTIIFTSGFAALKKEPKLGWAFIGIGAALAAVGYLGKHTFNNTRTKGFKKLTLTAKDDDPNLPITITLCPDKVLKIEAVSDSTYTDFSYFSKVKQGESDDLIKFVDLH